MPGSRSTAEEGRITDAYVDISHDLAIHYQTAGNGKVALIFIPGWTMTTHAFEHQLEHLADSERFTAITYDPRAHGLSTMTSGGHYYEQHGRDLHAFIEALRLRTVVLVAWSNGGFDALAYLRQFGADKLAGLMMLDATPKGRGADLATEWVWFGTKEQGDQDDIYKLFAYDVLVDREAANIPFAEWLLEDRSPENMQFVLEQTNHTPDVVASVLSTSSWFLDYSEDLKRLDGKVPLIYVVREEWNDLVASWANTNTPTATVVAFGKHMMFWERPAEFNQILDTFLQAVAC